MREPMAIFVGQGKTKSCYLKNFIFQYLVEFLRYGPNFCHVIIPLTDFKITFCKIRSRDAPCLISRGVALSPTSWVLIAISDLGLERVKIPKTASKYIKIP